MRHIDYYTDIVMGKKGGSGGGITPSGTLPISIQENGTTKHDVTQYAEAEITVQVPEPEGTKEINIVQNGDSTEDVKSYANAHIVVAVPEPTGNIDISQNGQVDVKQYATANVQVPEATGEKVIDIVANGTTTEDVKAFASAKINVNVPQEGIVPSGRLEIAENGVKDVTEYAEVNVQVPVGVFPEGTLEISDNGKQDVTNYAEVNVNVPKGITPEGTKEISVVQNGVTEEDVTEFAKVKITTSVPEPAGTLTINENGKKDVTQYAEVDVQVPAPTGERSVTYTENKTIDEDVSDISTLHVTVQVPESGGGGEYQSKYETLLKTLLNPGSISDDNLLTLNDDDIVSLRERAFYNCEILGDVNLQNLESTDAYVFYGCTNMKTFSAHKLTTVQAYTFYSCGKLVSVDLPEVVSVQSAAFNTCSALKKLVLPKCKSMNGDDIFRPSGIVTIDMLGGTDGKFACNMYTVNSFQTLVLRDTSGVTPLTGRFKETVSIYVPDELVEQYKVATNWSTYATQIKPLSEYVEV